MEGPLDWNQVWVMPDQRHQKCEPNKQNTLLSQHVTNKNQFRALMSVLRNEHILVLTARGGFLMQYTHTMYLRRTEELCVIG